MTKASRKILQSIGGREQESQRAPAGVRAAVSIVDANSQLATTGADTAAIINAHRDLANDQEFPDYGPEQANLPTLYAACTPTTRSLLDKLWSDMGAEVSPVDQNNPLVQTTLQQYNEFRKQQQAIREQQKKPNLLRRILFVRGFESSNSTKWR